jgi:hypothetical protein
LALYPLAHRRRYGEEMGALLEDQGASPRAVADLLRGAAAAHLHPEPGLVRELGRDDRLKLGIGSTLLAWAVFALIGLGLYKTTEGASFTAAGDAHPVLGAAHLAIQAFALIVTAALVLGAIQIAVAALGRAPDPRAATALGGMRDRGAAQRAAAVAALGHRAVRRAGPLAAGCVAVFVLATAALVVVAQAGSTADGVDTAILAVWAGLALACGVGIAIAGRLALFAVDVPRGALRVAGACATVATLGMVGIAAATAVYLGALLAGAPDLAAEANGPGGLLSVGASLGVQLALMIAVCAMSGGSRLRAGTRAR